MCSVSRCVCCVAVVAVAMLYVVFCWLLFWWWVRVVDGGVVLVVAAWLSCFGVVLLRVVHLFSVHSDHASQNFPQCPCHRACVTVYASW